MGGHAVADEEWMLNLIHLHNWLSASCFLSDSPFFFYYLSRHELRKLPAHRDPACSGKSWVPLAWRPRPSIISVRGEVGSAKKLMNWCLGCCYFVSCSGSWGWTRMWAAHELSIHFSQWLFCFWGGKHADFRALFLVAQSCHLWPCYHILEVIRRNISDLQAHSHNASWRVLYKDLV